MTLRILPLAAGAGLALIAAPVMTSAADVAAGKKLFKRCAICHTLAKGKKKIGPSLFAVVGRKAGSQKGYAYSAAIKAAAAKNHVWSEDALFGYLGGPKKYLAKLNGKPLANKMPFKIGNAKQRRNIIAYLKTVK